MAHLAALAIFAALAAACWFVSLLLYRSTVGGPDPAAAPHYRAAAAIGAATVTSFIPFPGGYLAGLVVWSAAAFGFLGLPPRRAAVLAAYLAAGSFLTRIVVLGVIDLLDPHFAPTRNAWRRPW